MDDLTIRLTSADPDTAERNRGVCNGWHAMSFAICYKRIQKSFLWWSKVDIYLFIYDVV